MHSKTGRSSARTRRRLLFRLLVTALLLHFCLCIRDLTHISIHGDDDSAVIDVYLDRGEILQYSPDGAVRDVFGRDIAKSHIELQGNPGSQTMALYAVDVVTGSRTLLVLNVRERSFKTAMLPSTIEGRLAAGDFVPEMTGVSSKTVYYSEFASTNSVLLVEYKGRSIYVDPSDCSMRPSSAINDVGYARLPSSTGFAGATWKNRIQLRAIHMRHRLLAECVAGEAIYYLATSGKRWTSSWPIKYTLVNRATFLLAPHLFPLHDGVMSATMRGAAKSGNIYIIDAVEARVFYNISEEATVFARCDPGACERYDPAPTVLGVRSFWMPKDDAIYATPMLIVTPRGARHLALVSASSATNPLNYSIDAATNAVFVDEWGSCSQT